MMCFFLIFTPDAEKNNQAWMGVQFWPTTSLSKPLVLFSPIRIPVLERRENGLNDDFLTDNRWYSVHKGYHNSVETPVGKQQ